MDGTSKPLDSADVTAHRRGKGVAEVPTAGHASVRRVEGVGHENLAGPPERMYDTWMEDRRNWVEIVRETGVAVE